MTIEAAGPENSEDTAGPGRTADPRPGPGSGPGPDPDPALALAPESGEAAAEEAEEEERRASWFELFCDLVFVAAVGQVTHRLGGAPGARAVLAACALFVPVWWTWVLYAVHSNRAERAGAETPPRLLTMAGTAGVCGMAAYLGRVGHGTGADAGFVACYLAARAVIGLLYGWAARGDARFAGLARSFAAGSAATAVLWLGALALPAPGPRYAVWAVAMAAELALPLTVARRHAVRAGGDAGHLGERFGLFTIIVLGEIVLGFTNGLSHAARTAPATAAAAGAAFALCGALWWTYFNASATRPGGHAAIATRPRSRHAYVYGHLPLQAGLAMAGGVLPHAVAARDAVLPAATIVCLAGGVTAFLASGALIRAAFTGLREAVVVLRLGTAVAVPVLAVALGGRLAGPALLGVLAAAVALGVAAEAPFHRRRVAGTGA
jgi:low temperature requirement protein LtrA